MSWKIINQKNVMPNYKKNCKIHFKRFEIKCYWRDGVSVERVVVCVQMLMCVCCRSCRAWTATVTVRPTSGTLQRTGCWSRGCWSSVQMWRTPADRWSSASSGQDGSLRSTLHRWGDEYWHSWEHKCFCMIHLSWLWCVCVWPADGWGEETGASRGDAGVWQEHLQRAQISDLLHRLLHHRHVRRLGW